MDIDTQILKRLDEFIEAVQWSYADFAKRMGIHKQQVKNYREGNSDIQKLTIKLNENGCNINWLYSGDGDMFADNYAGRKLKSIYGRPKIDPKYQVDEYIRRSLQWISIHYGSFRNYCVIKNFDYKKLDALLMKNYLDMLIQDDLIESGCNMEWINTGEGSRYADNDAGRAMKQKYSGELQTPELEAPAAPETGLAEKIISAVRDLFKEAGLLKK